MNSTINKPQIIATVKNQGDLDAALQSQCQTIFILFGNICNIGRIVNQVKMAGKSAFVHVDFLEGAANKNIVIEFLSIVSKADGIISTKSSMIKAAKAHDLISIQRIFMIDSITYHNIDQQVAQSKPDCIELMPGAMPKVIRWVTDKVNIPVIAGGLVCDEEDALAAFKAGANAISTTNQQVWALAETGCKVK
ncbi:hypothetical protein RJ45_13300 [Photobacterium gaetbulicola]|uniref:Glycerol-3-phosphate responsive antiterminator n=1 Tax=Photobacterium gaetbulicola TaxID=1295392 RepID=A0A0B9G3M8_9GAMM|nr:glycerol-3-phosphate responsive antiterminator [Photobacterium gaetbulicola]KHT63358.1 hypothetical protein RJ45_13300 [Photobacterium gaetbulicola]